MKTRYQFKGKLKKRRSLNAHGRQLGTVDNKDPAIREFYNSKAWKNLSYRMKKQRPACEQCGDTDNKHSVNHKIRLVEMADPLTDPRALDPDNLSVLCNLCHARTDQRSREQYKIKSLRDSLDWLDD
jgi:HNH endonuclease